MMHVNFEEACGSHSEHYMSSPTTHLLLLFEVDEVSQYSSELIKMIHGQ